MRRSFTEIVEITGAACKQFDGDRKYISTGSVHHDVIYDNETEIVNFKNKPSRANLEVRAGDILFAKMQGTRKTLLISEGLSRNIYSTGFYSVRPKSGLITEKCLYYLIDSELFRAEKDKNCAGATQKAINNYGLKQIELNIPDYSTQKKIGERLDLLMITIRSKEKQLHQLDTLVKARFVEMFEDEYAEDKLLNLCTFIDYRGKTPRKAKDGLPFITAKNVKMHHLSLEPQEYISKDVFDKVMTRGTPREGDVVFTTEAPLGNVCRIPHLDTKFYVGQRIVTLQTSKLNPAYLEYVLSSDGFRRKMMQKSSGSTVVGIRVKLLEQLTVPVPSLELQDSFANFVAQVDKSKFAILGIICKLHILFARVRMLYL